MHEAVAAAAFLGGALTSCWAVCKASVNSVVCQRIELFCIMQLLLVQA